MTVKVGVTYCYFLARLPSVSRAGNADAPSTSQFHCSNCGVEVPTAAICKRCSQLPWCRLCRRHLPTGCFDMSSSDSTICAACRLKKNQNVRQSAQGVVTEVELPIDDRDVAFESCVQRNADAIRRVVDEHQYRLR